MSDRDHRTRERAYYLWEHAGRPAHRDAEFWDRAQAEIGAEETTASKAGAKFAKKGDTRDSGAKVADQAAPKREPVKREAGRAVDPAATVAKPAAKAAAAEASTGSKEKPAPKPAEPAATKAPVGGKSRK